MKRKPHFNLLVFFTLLLVQPFSSCIPDEDLLSEILIDSEDDPTDDEPTEEDPTETDVPTDVIGLDINTTPCDYTLDSVSSGQTLKVACQLDLDGKTVNLPSDVTLEYDGGEIINGTINFDSGKVDGRLLNFNLEIIGNVSLISTTFEFHPERWEIVQGETTSEIAQMNNINLENLMFFTKNLGAAIFVIDEFDAYFETSKVTSTTTNQNFYPSQEALNIPSDFHLKMSDNTTLRVFPTIGNTNSVLLAIHEASNVTVSGGILYGDRDLRVYPKENAENGAHLFTIRSGSNVVLDGIKFTMGSLGGLNINSTGFSFNPDYNPTYDVLVKNCVFDKCRMMSIALTDGHNIIIDNNTFIDTAQPTQNSDGGVVAYAMNMEPVRTRDQNTGELVNYQLVYDVTIKNNTERGSRTGSFNIYAGDNIIIENNQLETVVTWSYASNSKVRNNKFNPSSTNTRPAILAAGDGETVFGNEISGNIITDYGIGITAYFGKMDIFDNTFINVKSSIVLDGVVDMNVRDNIITSSKDNSRGITFQITSANNINITNNEIDVMGNSLRFTDLNQGVADENNSITVSDNLFKSTAVAQFTQTSGVVYQNNDSFGRIQISSSSNIKFLSNIISSEDGHGIALNNINSDITINENTISRPSNFECIFIKETTNPNEINMSGNNCN